MNIIRKILAVLLIIGLIGLVSGKGANLYFYDVEVSTGNIFQAWSPITANIDFDPDTLNLKSEGQWVTVYIYIELPNGYDVSEIDASSIKLNDIVSVDPSAPTDIGDYDNDGISDLMVKFDRS